MKIKLLKKGYIFNKESDRSVHSISLLKKENYIYAFWFEGSKELADDVNIYFSIYDIKNNFWRKKNILINDSKRSLGNTIPVSFGNTLRVYYVAKEGKDWTESTFWYIDSFDNGLSWETPKCFYNKYGLLFGTKILKLNAKTYCLPVYNELEWYSEPWITNDIKNNKWKRIGESIKTKKGNIQQSLELKNNNEIFSLLRTRDGYIYSSTYSFKTEKWTEALNEDIPNPNSRLALEKINNSYILCCNDIGLTEGIWGKRNKLSLYLSEDTKKWNKVYSLENDENGDFISPWENKYNKSEYSYPWIIPLDEDKLMVAYTFNRFNLKYNIFNIN